MKNLIKIITLVISFGVLVHDFYMLGLSHFFTHQMYSFTWFGLATFCIALFLFNGILMDFYENKKMSATRTSQHHKTLR